MPNDKRAEVGTVTNHARAMLIICFLGMPVFPYIPIATIDPTLTQYFSICWQNRKNTLQWVVETGIPMAEAPKTVSALISSIQNPRHGVIFVISEPIATISLAPQVHRPAVMPKPPNNNKYHGVRCSVVPKTNFGISIPPCQ